MKQKIAIQGLKNQLNIQEHSQHYLTYNIKSLKSNNIISVSFITPWLNIREPVRKLFQKLSLL